MLEMIATGKTVEEATAIACAMLRLTRDEVSIEILEMPGRRFFKTIPAKVKATAVEELTAAAAPVAPAPEKQAAPAAAQPAQPAKPAQRAAEKPAQRTAAQPAAAQPVQEPAVPVEIASVPKLAAAVAYLETVFAHMGAGAVTITAQQQGEAYVVKVEGENVGVLIGHRGETMESLSYLAALAANRTEGDYLKLGLDVAGYRSKREADLQALARRIAAKVIKSGRSYAMDAMNPYERRIIHTVIGDMEGVRSESRGEGLQRRVVVYSTAANARNSAERPNSSRAPRRDGNRRGPARGGNRDARGPRPERSSVPAREFADAPRTDSAAPVAPKRTQLVDDAEGFALYGKIEL